MWCLLPIFFYYSKMGSDLNYYKTVIATIPQELHAQIKHWRQKNVPSDMIDKTGEENEVGFHITTLYGLTTATTKDVQNILNSEYRRRYIRVAFGNIDIFQSENIDGQKVEGRADVLICNINSPHLEELNGILRKNFEHHEDHRTYIPHMTIAYVKAGSCNRLVGMPMFKTRYVLHLHKLIFSDENRRCTSIQL